MSCDMYALTAIHSDIASTPFISPHRITPAFCVTQQFRRGLVNTYLEIPAIVLEIIP